MVNLPGIDPWHVRGETDVPTIAGVWPHQQDVGQNAGSHGLRPDCGGWNIYHKELMFAAVAHPVPFLIQPRCAEIRYRHNAVTKSPLFVKISASDVSPYSQLERENLYILLL